VTRFRSLYGAGPLHLVAVLASFAVIAYAASRELSLTGRPERVVVWFGGSLVGHDLVLLPAYALAGSVLLLLAAPRGRRTPLRIAALNHVRLPALLSGLLLLVWYPVVAGPAGSTFTRATGLDKGVYLGRWLALTALLFAASALVFLVRLPALRRSSRGHA
jgi:hypothetical protein